MMRLLLENALYLIKGVLCVGVCQLRLCKHGYHAILRRRSGLLCILEAGS